MRTKQRRASHPYAGIAAWNFKVRHEVHTYDQALKAIGSSPYGRVRVAPNTWLRACAAGVALSLYSTVILLWCRDGQHFIADNGGWATPTTTARLNAFAPPGWHFYHNDTKLVGHYRGEYAAWCQHGKLISLVPRSLAARPASRPG